MKPNLSSPMLRRGALILIALIALAIRAFFVALIALVVPFEIALRVTFAVIEVEIARVEFVAAIATIGDAVDFILGRAEVAEDDIRRCGTVQFTSHFTVSSEAAAAAQRGRVCGHCS